MRQITEEQVEAFRERLRATDHAPGTVANYCRHLACFAQWLGGREAAPGAAAAWRSHLLERGYTPGTINTMLVSLNRFFRLSRLERLPGEDACASSGGCSGRTAKS